MCGPRDVEGQGNVRILLLGFFLLTFTTTWAAWLIPPSFSIAWFFSLGGPVFLLGVFAPAFVAIALTLHGEGLAGVQRLLGRIAKWNVGMRYYLFAIVYMATTKLFAAVIHRMALGEWPAFGDTPAILMFSAIIVTTLAQAGEEVGWRGYALPRLAALVGLGGASILIGVLWALWHLPLFFLQGSGSDGQSFPVYLIHVTALSVAMSWLYWKTEGSLLLVMIMHASVNNTSGIVPAALPEATHVMSLDGSLVAWVTVGLSWAIAVLLLYQMRGGEFRRIC